MPPPKLNPTAKKQLLAASRDSVVRAIRLLPAARWLAPSNSYVRDPARRVAAQASSAAFETGQLRRFVGASVALHCFDGWAYLSHALHAHLLGDVAAARHLAYYAELRAAISLLGSEGVVVLNHKHLVLDDKDECRVVRQGDGTHVFAWLALRHWAQRRPAARLLGSLIRPAGVSINDWVASMRGGGGWQPVGNHWLSTWGLDVTRFGEDRNARNRASYRPVHLTQDAAMGPPERARFVRGLWSLFEPTAIGDAFATLDRHILRRSLEFAHDAGIRTPAQRAGDIADTVTSVLGEGPHALAMTEFLTRAVEPTDPEVLELASATDPDTTPTHHVQMMARAALLLRVATGSCSDLYAEAGHSLGGKPSWWHELGEQRGFWDPGEAPAPADTVDLYADIEDALDALEAIDADAGGNPSAIAFLRDASISLLMLGSCERIPLWAMVA